MLVTMLGWVGSLVEGARKGEWMGYCSLTEYNGKFLSYVKAEEFILYGSWKVIMGL